MVVHAMKRMYLLFWIVGGIGKEAGVKPSHDPIWTPNDNPMLIGMEKLLVKDDAPNLMHDISPAVTKYIRSWCLSYEFCIKVMKIAWELENK